MLYHETRDPVQVQKALGRANLQNTQIYTSIEAVLFNQSSDELYSAAATTAEEVCRLVEAGFEYVYYANNIKVSTKESSCYI